MSNVEVLLIVMVYTIDSVRSVVRTIPDFADMRPINSTATDPVMVGNAVGYYVHNIDEKRIECYTLPHAYPLMADPNDESVWLESLSFIAKKIHPFLNTPEGGDDEEVRSNDDCESDPMDRKFSEE